MEEDMESEILAVYILPKGILRLPQASMEHSAEQPARVSLYSGNCPDPSCQTRLCWLSNYSSVECTGCGQHHDLRSLQNLKQEKDDAYNTALYTTICQSLIANFKPEPGTDNIKVHGLSNYKCKLLSPLLSHYGMDKPTGQAKLLPDIFDCGVLGEYAFCIDPEHISIPGYGRDASGSVSYLKDTLNVIQETNGSEERLVPIHSDGDGHCLVHAISRALVGRELFYYPLRLNLMHHFQDNLDRYKALFNDFVDKDEWGDIISECDPEFVPKDGESAGLRNIHIFGLANVLRRPIILLDSPKGIECSGDYSGVFLPILLTPEQCKNKKDELHCPLCIAWSSQGRNHFIPLVGVKDKPCPRLPRYMLQTTWGVTDPTLIDTYINFEDGCCNVGGTRMLQEGYIHRLVHAMEEVFMKQHGVHPDLVADVNRYIFRTQGFVGTSPNQVTMKTLALVQEKALLFCLCCGCLTSLRAESRMLQNGGDLYKMACKEEGTLMANKHYIFKDYQLTCRYDPDLDVLVPDVLESICPFCKTDRKQRHVRADGSVEYINGDVTREPAGPKAKCTCGFKHFYKGKLYDNRPRELPVPVEWGGKKSVEFVQWWENESDPQLDSNVYQVAKDLVQNLYPGEFGIETLEQKIVAAILHQTAIKENKDEMMACDGADQAKWNAEEASKIIMSGCQRQSIHKEELMKSDTESELRKKIAANAPTQQAKKSLTPTSAPGTGSKRGSASNSPARAAKGKAAGDKSSSPPPDGAAAKAASSSSDAGLSSAKPDSPSSALKPNEKKIRIVSGNGCSETVTLTEDLTFSQLQQVVYKATRISPEHQKLRVGFPPKVLSAPAPGEEEEIVPLNHGDKINVESNAAEGSSLPQQSPRSSLRSHFDARMPDEEAILSKLAARHRGGDLIDGSLIKLGLQASQSGADLWHLVQNQPHHFSVGGVYYRQASRDIGLEPNKHCAFPTLPYKVFAYNADLDRLELCLGDLGHFEVEPDVERKAKEHLIQGHKTHEPHHFSMTPESSLASLSEDANKATFGTSGAVSKGHNSQKVFEGQGHSLRGASMDAKMPEDVPLTENIRGAARRLQDYCDPGHDHSSIAEEDVERMEVGEGELSKDYGAVGGEGEGLPQAKYTRKGPGYSVLEPVSSAPRMQTPDDAVRQLFQNMQHIMDASNKMEEEEEEEEEDAERNMEQVDEKEQGEQTTDPQPRDTVETSEKLKPGDVQNEVMEMT